MPKTRTQRNPLLNHPYFDKNTTTDDTYNELPLSVKHRVQALRKLQLEQINAKTSYEQNMLNLQAKYHNDIHDMSCKRQKIVNGQYEPKQSDVLQSVVDDDDYVPSKTIAGIPEFWLKVLQNTELASCWLEDKDLPLLRFLLDIRVNFGDASAASGDVKILDPKDEETDKLSDVNMFMLDFEFAPNSWFHNTLLTKTYYYKTFPASEDNPMEYKGAVIVRAEGCDIQWKDMDVDITKTIVTKKQKNAKTGATRTVKKFEKADSFFHFFSPPKMDENATDEQKEETEDDIEIDYDLGLCFRDKIIPSATIIFTNEYEESDGEYDTDDEDSDEDESDEESEGSNDDESESDVDAETEKQAPECNQQ